MRLLDAEREVAMLKHTFAVLVAAAALAACSDSDARLTPAGPAALRVDDGLGRAPFVGINPAALRSELINNSVGCPAVQPFLVRANLVFQITGDDVLFISSVRMQFTDTSG